MNKFSDTQSQMDISSSSSCSENESTILYELCDTIIERLRDSGFEIKEPIIEHMVRFSEDLSIMIFTHFDDEEVEPESESESSDEESSEEESSSESDGDYIPSESESESESE